MTSRRIIFFAAFLPWAAHAAIASAEAAKSVALLSPPEDLVIAESATRLAAELTTAGFMVVKAACVADDDQCAPTMKTAGATTAEIKLWRASGAVTIGCTPSVSGLDAMPSPGPDAGRGARIHESPRNRPPWHSYLAA